MELLRPRLELPPVDLAARLGLAVKPDEVVEAAVLIRIGRVARIDAANVLSRRQSAANDRNVVKEKKRHEDGEEQRVGNENARSDVDGDGAQRPLVNKMRNNDNVDVEGKKDGKEDEQEESPVVPRSHAVRQPPAVMVKAVHAVVASRAVRGVRRPEDLARVAVLKLIPRPVLLGHALEDGEDLLGHQVVRVEGMKDEALVNLLVLNEPYVVTRVRVTRQYSRITAGRPKAKVE